MSAFDPKQTSDHFRGCTSARRENFGQVSENYKTVTSLAREFAVL